MVIAHVFEGSSVIALKGGVAKPTPSQQWTEGQRQQHARMHMYA